MTCHFVLLAEGPTGRIEVCRSCGCVAVHVGPMSMRISVSAFSDLTTTMQRADVALSTAHGVHGEVSFGEPPRGQA